MINKTSKLFLVTFIFLNFCPIFSAYAEEKKDYIHLNLNENPYGCFPSVKKAMEDSLRLSAFYPDDQRIQLISELASLHDVQPEQVLVSNGLSSILFIIADALVDKETTVIVPDPTFELFIDCVQTRGGKVIHVPLRDDYTHDLDAMLAQVDENVKIVLICNPNNPTGTITSRENIDQFLKKLPPHVFVLIDEAYYDFGKKAPGYLSYLDKHSERERLIIGRTFSKAYGMAGMRIGYAVSSKKTIELLNKCYNEDNTNLAALCGASIALKDQAALEEAIANYALIRNEFYNQSLKRGIHCIPSIAPFVMVDLSGRNASEVSDHFKNHGILIGKSYSAIPGYIRVSLGSPSQMENFWNVWDKLP